MRSRLGLKALGLCALMAGVMAFSASAAQAADTGEWMVAGANITGSTQSPLLEGSLESNIGRLLTTIGGLTIEVTCTAGTVEGIKLIKEGVTTEGDVKFTGCTVSKVGPPLEALGKCTVNSVGAAHGTILSLPGKGLLELHTGGKPVTLIVPTSGVFAHLEFEEEGGACGALPEELLVQGSLAVEDCENKAETEQATHLIKEFATLSHLWVISDTAEHHVTLDGSANLKLAGGAKWSGLAH